MLYFLLVQASLFSPYMMERDHRYDFTRESAPFLLMATEPFSTCAIEIISRPQILRPSDARKIRLSGARIEKNNKSACDAMDNCYRDGRNSKIVDEYCARFLRSARAFAISTTDAINNRMMMNSMLGHTRHLLMMRIFFVSPTTFACFSSACSFP